MLKKFNKYMQQRINLNYNKIKNKNSKSIEDASFLTFLEIIEKIMTSLFIIVGSISIILFFKYEVLPLIW